MFRDVKKAWVTDESGRTVAQRHTITERGETYSYLYEAEDGLLGPKRLGDIDNPTEYAKHHEDGTTTAYNWIPGVLGGRRGEEK